MIMNWETRKSMETQYLLHQRHLEEEHMSYCSCVYAARYEEGSRKELKSTRRLWKSISS